MTQESGGYGPNYTSVGHGSHSGVIPNATDSTSNSDQYGAGANYSSAAHQGGGSSNQLINGTWYSVSNRTGYKQPISGVTVQPINGQNYYVDAYGTVLGLYTAPSGSTGKPLDYSGQASGPSWYEQQQIALDKQRLADAEAQQVAAQKAAESAALDKFNTDFRDYQLKSPYGAQYGPTYFSPAGSVFAQRVPESSILKQGFADAGTPDPWASTGTVPAGYTGVSYSNPQHPGLVDFGQPSVQQNMPQPGGNTPATAAAPTQGQFQQWHDLAHTLPPPAQTQPQSPPMGDTQSSAQPAAPTMPVQMGGQVTNLPHFAMGGNVPGPTGSPQLIVAEGGEHVTPVGPTSPDGMNGGGDWQTMFNTWHDALHSGPRGIPNFSPTSTHPVPTNVYGQHINQNTMHGMGEDVVPGAMGYTPESQKFLNNHVQYGPELTGQNGLGGLITPNGTPVVMSAWQRANLDPTSVANYEDYAHSIAGWSGADLANYGQRITGSGDLGDLSRPTSWAPIGIQPAPSGG